MPNPPARDLILRVWHVDPLRCPVCQDPRAHFDTDTELSAAADRNAAFMRQSRVKCHPCRINAAFRGQCQNPPARYRRH